MKIKIKRTSGVKTGRAIYAQQFFFHLQARNGKILMHSETYKRIPWKIINNLAINLKCAIINETIKAK
jgi:hypothetical protein